MRLHKDREAFEQIVKTVADHFGLSAFQVEKDYYVSLFLKELNKVDSDVRVVFKGGTSLSKCYDVIDRFSEDIDLAVKFTTGKVTTGERRKLKKMIVEMIEGLGMELLNPLDVRSRKDHNAYSVGYDHAFQTDENTVAHMIIETIVVYKPYPINRIMTSNFIAKYLETSRRTDLIDRYDLSPFSMFVQAMERTCVDKLFAISDYHLQKKYSRHSRHIYDIHKIWTSNMIDKKVVTGILEEVIKDRQLYGNQNLSCQPGMSPQNVLKDVFSSNAYKEDYESITSTLIYKPVEYEVCMSTLKTIIDEGILPDRVMKY